MYVRTDRCYNEGDSKANYVRSETKYTVLVQQKTEDAEPLTPQRSLSTVLQPIIFSKAYKISENSYRCA